MLACFLLTASQAASQSWPEIEVGGGVKPSIALDRLGRPAITYVSETSVGFIRYAYWDPSSQRFVSAEITNGPVFGPTSFAFSPSGNPHLTYHDHAAGDQVHAYRLNNRWTFDTIDDPGHDGWDNSGVFDSAGVFHTASIDPTGGVEYVRFGTSSDWTLENAAGPVMYGFATSIALDGSGNPHIAYYQTGVRDLMLTGRGSSGWIVDTVDTDGDVGRYPSLQIDSAGVLHVAYYQHLGDSTGLVKYATKSEAGWSVSVVDSLRNVFVGGSIPARNLLGLDLDSGGLPHIAYSDKRVLKLASFDGQAWSISILKEVVAGGLPLGQTVALTIGSNDQPHVAFYQLRSELPVVGTVVYTSPSVPSSSGPDELPDTDTFMSSYPNPFGRAATIRFMLADPEPVQLDLFDVRGRHVRRVTSSRRHAGLHEATLDAADLPAGVYILRLVTTSTVITSLITKTSTR